MKKIVKGEKATFTGYLLTNKEYAEFKQLKNRLEIASKLKSFYKRDF